MLFLVLLSACNQTRSVLNINSVRFIEVLQFVQVDNLKVLTQKDSTSIFYGGNYAIYEVPTYYRSSNIRSDKQTKITSETDIKEEIKYKYIIRNKHNPYGYCYDSLAAKTHGKKILIDTFLNKTIAANVPFYNKVNDTLVSYIHNINGDLIERHICKKRFDSSYPDSLYYHFSNKLRDVNFSFSNELDSTRKMKLFKVEFIFSPTTDPQNGTVIPRRALSFEIKRNEFDKTLMMDFTRKFQLFEKTTSISTTPKSR